MAKHFHAIINLPDRSYQAIARSALKTIATKAGLSGYRLAEAEIIIAEITTNLIKHSPKGGQVLCCIMEEEGQAGIEFIAVDNGPGIQLVAQAMKDGVSSKNTLGSGLGAIQRLSDVFDLYSLKEWGTILLSRVYQKKSRAVKQQDRIKMETIRVAKTGEERCGDNWSFGGNEKVARVVMADGLGHGADAALAADQAISIAGTLTGMQANEHLKTINTGIRKTRGAVMSVVYIDSVNKQLVYCGVGNILTRLINQPLSMTARTFSSYNGIVGHTIPGTINNLTIPWDKKVDMLVMHTDGLSGRWDLAKYPKILLHHPVILCAALFKDHFRGTDDATVSVIRYVKHTS